MLRWRSWYTFAIRVLDSKVCWRCGGASLSQFGRLTFVKWFKKVGAVTWHHHLPAVCISSAGALASELNAEHREGPKVIDSPPVKGFHGLRWQTKSKSIPRWGNTRLKPRNSTGGGSRRYMGLLCHNHGTAHGTKVFYKRLFFYS